MLMDKSKFFTILLKTVSYFITLLLGALGMSLTTSCTSQRSFQSHGAGIIILHDTSYVHHDNGFSYSRYGFKFK